MINDTDFLHNPRIKQLQQDANQAEDEQKKLKIIKLLFNEIQNASRSIVDELDNGIDIKNFDIVEAAFQNTFAKNTKILTEALKGIKLSTDSQNKLLSDLAKENERKMNDEFQTVKIRMPHDKVTVVNWPDEPEPLS